MELLDIPLIALSNGQTRRARSARAVMKAPGLLLLNEPLSECSSFSSISRNFPNPPTFFRSLLEIAAFSPLQILASRTPPPPLLRSLRPSFTLSLASFPSFLQILNLSPYLAGLHPISRSYLLALLADLHASRSLHIMLGTRVQEELPA
ncbi:uncharacterized protein LACBIDRAFT_298107 [Laccaria bicolor S238N-H82]|uniref:Predicted protein n=1 Tax=Laccaria bicolor (strain S238N-H82 / ATCC MYA-4686) TaxID=486041 RepID=B0DC96_LACBS|nr:uncharacterized protein LACBIDRAFT_298107 [Laccaria bicolor S238N-H82]EDR07691.1 predicted protein [Laccaria bicolor S238N-H82]|eukprot:XP_001881480.1 predicted protein [Laccaria bicolor S238N-H82]